MDIFNIPRYYIFSELCVIKYWKLSKKLYHKFLLLVKFITYKRLKSCYMEFFYFFSFLFLHLFIFQYFLCCILKNIKAYALLIQLLKKILNYKICTFIRIRKPSCINWTYHAINLCFHLSLQSLFLLFLFLLFFLSLLLFFSFT